jgi:ribosomal protein S2
MYKGAMILSEYMPSISSSIFIIFTHARAHTHINTHINAISYKTNSYIYTFKNSFYIFNIQNNMQ